MAPANRSSQNLVSEVGGERASFSRATSAWSARWVAACAPGGRLNTANDERVGRSSTASREAYFLQPRSRMAERDLPDAADRRRTLHRGLLAAVGALLPVLLVLLVWKAADAFLLLFTGYLASVLFRGLAEKVRDHSPLSYRWALAVVLVTLTALAILAAALLAPRVDRQVAELAEQIPRAVDQLTEQMDDYAWAQWLRERTSAESQNGGGASMLGHVLGIFSSAFGAVAGFFIIFFVGLYFSISPALYERGFLALVPPRHRQRLAEVLSETDDTLRHWLKGKIVAMLLVGVLTWAGLLALGIPLAFALALIAALLTFIPNFGPIASAIPPVLLALAEDPRRALYVVLLFAAIQVVESYVITPMIQKKAIAMPPAVIIAAQVVMSILFGFLGLLVSTPLAAAAIVLVRELYVEDVLEKDGETPTAEEVVADPAAIS